MGLPPGTTIGRYEIGRELGRGMMGVVYEARDPALDRRVALKTIDPAVAATPAAREAFERRVMTEARIAAGLSHPGIVMVHDVGRDDASCLLFIALEYLPGETLASLLARGAAPPWRESFEIVRRVALALQHAHERGVVHRDIKPANIMLLPSGEPKVMDFGIAKVEAAHLTAAGQFFGTPLYMSPEQALSRAVDARTDVFALGAVAYPLLTGRQAFEAESVVRILGRVVYQDPPPPCRLVPDLPADVDYVIARALAKLPEDRYHQARLLAEDIQDLLKGQPPRHRAGWVPPPAASPAEAAPSLIAQLGSAAFTPTITVAPGDGVPEPPASDPARKQGRHQGSPRERALLATLLLAVAALVWTQQSSSLTSAVANPVTALPAPRAISASPAPAPAPTPAAARVVVDFEHPLESGTLRLWVDGDEVLVEKVKGDVTRNLVLFKLKGGVLTEVLEVKPGRHQFRVQVGWEGEARDEEIAGKFDAGETYRLAVRLGRVKKELSLRWTR
jgi:serine/threonine-protein kinase